MAKSVYALPVVSPTMMIFVPPEYVVFILATSVHADD
jgi:hypothetical protein